MLAGPGGVGKGTIARRLVEREPGLWLSRSWTTRPRRPGEPDDAYHFATEEEFDAEIDRGGFLEWAEFQSHRYGTPWPSAPNGDDIVLEIDVQGAAQVRESDPGALIVFLLPPSTDELRRRLEGRGDPPEKVQARLDLAATERSWAARLGAIEVVNDDLDTAERQVADLVTEARLGAAGGSISSD